MLSSTCVMAARETAQTDGLYPASRDTHLMEMLKLRSQILAGEV